MPIPLFLNHQSKKNISPFSTEKVNEVGQVMEITLTLQWKLTL